MRAIRGTLLVLGLLAPGLALAGADGAAADETSGRWQCLEERERAAAALYPALQREATKFSRKRKAVLEQLRSPDAIDAHQQRLRDFFIERIGGFPRRTPLNARIVRTIDGGEYRIEMLIFESQPHHHVTANVYVPRGTGPFPAVVVASGHSRSAKAAPYNQRFGIMLARHGMIALCYDPIGQGERSQILDASGRPRFRGTTTEHFLLGVGSILVGRNVAGYRIWDAMRAIDYLCSRKDVDPRRIGMTGCSGGGTLTAYTMALDERVQCAAPACYITTFERLIATIGPQDAEQNVFGQVAFGMDQPDYLIMRAPRPTLVAATTEDFFDISGTWDAVRQANRIYTRLGHPEAVSIVEADGKHGVKPVTLAAITHWMCRWLRQEDRPVDIDEPAVREAADLQCTPDGQVLLLPGEKSVFDLNSEYATQLAARRPSTPPDPPQFAERLCRRLRIDNPTTAAAAVVHRRGHFDWAGVRVDRLVLETAQGRKLPALLFTPPNVRDKPCVLLHPRGKTGDLAQGRRVRALLEEGRCVLTVDLAGQGETAGPQPDALLGDWKTFFLCYLLDRTLAGIRVQDALAAADFASRHCSDTGRPQPIHLHGVGGAGIVALHAAALQPDRFASVTLHDTPRAWTNLVGQPVPAGQLESLVPGALQDYDLPDLVERIGPQKVDFKTSSDHKTPEQP